MPALTLAVLLSIDTLKTCVVLDALTRSRHDSNRELIGQGLGNLASGVHRRRARRRPDGRDAGQHVERRAEPRVSGVIEGVLALVAFLVLGRLIAWVPIAALAGILIVIGVRMFDRHSLHFLKSALDHSRFRGDRRRGHRRADGQPDRGFRRRHRARDLAVHPRADRRLDRAPQESTATRPSPSRCACRRKWRSSRSAAIRRRSSSCRAACSSAPPTSSTRALEPELKTRKYIILDMRARADGRRHRRAHARADRGHAGRAQRLSHLQPAAAEPAPRHGHGAVLRPGRAWCRAESAARIFDELDDALEWVENRILEEAASSAPRRSRSSCARSTCSRAARRRRSPRSRQCMDKRSLQGGRARSSRAATPATNCS